MRKDLSDPI